MKLIFVLLLSFSCLFRSKRTEVIPVGQLFVGDVENHCTVSIGAQRFVREIRGCFRSQPRTNVVCTDVKYHREIRQCCNAATTDLLVLIGYRPRPPPCHHVQEIHSRYCVTAPDVTLEGNTCPPSHPCGGVTQDSSQPTVIDFNSVIEQEGETTDAGACLELDVRRYKGALRSGCFRIHSSSGSVRKCLHVRRYVPHRRCCADDEGVHQGSETPWDFASPCMQYREVEVDYCFAVPAEQLERCSHADAIACDAGDTY